MDLEASVAAPTCFSLVRLECLATDARLPLYSVLTCAPLCLVCCMCNAPLCRTTCPAAKMPLEIITKEDGKEYILYPKDGIEYEVFTSNKSVSGYAGVAKVPKKDGDKADKADRWRATYKDKTIGTFDTMIEE